MSTQSSPNTFINLPQGGGAIKGMGETFSPDLHTGTGNFSVPLALPPGRNGFQPQLGLVYSTGNGNGPFGLGWQLGIPGVSRKTAQGLPRYLDETAEYPGNPEHNDTFLLSGAEDLAPLRYDSAEHFIEYRPRTEGLFALIQRYYDAENDYWLVKTKDGLVSWYGTPERRGDDPAAVFDPAKPRRVFSWMLSETRDPFGNRIVYAYDQDLGRGEDDDKRRWNQLYLKSIQYIDYRDAEGQERFLVSVEFDYEPERPDPFSVYQSGFEIRTRRRCRMAQVFTHPKGQTILTRSTHFEYGVPDRSQLSLLRAVRVTGHDGEQEEALPPLEFTYSAFEPTGKRFELVQGRELPTQSLAAGQLELVDLNGNGLPDLLQLNGTARYWRNLGNGRFDLAREMRSAPAGLVLSDPGVLLMDANGEGRADLMLHRNGLSGFFPTSFKGEWDSRSFRKYRYAPTFDLRDPEVELLDLNGDGVTDALRSGGRLECFFNDAEKGWHDTLQIPRKPLEEFPNVNFSDPRVRLADMSGDGLQDIVLISDRNFDYWPNLGHGRWGRRITMRNAPALPRNYDPKRLLLGDLAGNGPSDLIYVDYGKVWLWINQNGNGFSEAVLIEGTPLVSDVDDIRLADLYGTGVSGLLFTANQSLAGRDHWFFLDLAGRQKPYLLHEMRNNLGALTRVEYRPSTEYYLQDYDDPCTRWQTPLPFPVLVVARTEVIDQVSKGKLATEYRYHHGYWDGVEREFRGFGMVEQFDTETIAVFNAQGLHGDADFIFTEEKHYTPPLHTKTWFHQGPIDLEEGDWHEPDRSPEYWSGDPPLLRHTERVNEFLKDLPNSRIRREALRTLRGSILRTELYALDGSPRQDRPYTVTEQAYGLMELETPPDGSKRRHIFFPFAVAQRTTQWERGEDPMTQFGFTEDYDDYGQPQTAIAIACPRGWRSPDDVFAKTRPFLATVGRTEFVYSAGETPYLKNRTAKTTAWELKHRGNLALNDLKAQAANPDFLELTGQSLTYYDGEAFTGLPFGQLGAHGAAVRSESLILTEEILREAWKTEAGEPEALLWLQNPDPDWPDEYPQAFRAQLPPRAGYIFHDDGGPQARGYWVEGGKTQLDIHLSPVGRGLPVAVRDALDRETTVQYDPYQLLPETVTDPLGLTQRAEYDYRVLQPYQAEDANGNRSRFAFSPLGLSTALFIHGKEGEALGDTPGQPSRRFEYDFFAFMDRGEPVYARSIAREYHALDADVPPSHADDTITTVEYSDGFGRQVQTRVQAEDLLFGDQHFGTGLLPTDIGQTPGANTGRRRLPGEPDNVVVSGWKIYNNKGLVVQQYEPYYDRGFGYATPEDYQLGQKAEMFYDPRGQVIRTLNPDGSEQRVLYGIPDGLQLTTDDLRPTPWEAYTYDANDLAPLCSAPDGIPLTNRAPEEHHFTPASIEIDALGRTIKAVQRNRQLRELTGDPLPPLEEYSTFSTYDIRGNLLTVTDALGREAFRYAYDLTFDEENGSRVWRIDSIDAGLRRIAFHALGMEIERRDSKGSLTLQACDRGNRLTQLWARNQPGEPTTLRQRLLYGDTEGLADNFKGKLYRHYDEAGLVEIHGYDFKGNPLASSRHTIRDDVVRPFLGIAAYIPFMVDWERADAETFYLETKTYRSDTSYDALNRPKRVIFPEDVSEERKFLRPAYNRAGALESVALLSPAGGGARRAGVVHLAYNAKGQRTLIAHDNGLMTRYEYDPHTFRLARLRTEKYRRESDSFVPDGGMLQDLAYRYDLAGNITQILDRGTGKGINGVYPGFDRDFTYDAIYRLLSGTGIEHSAYTHTSEPWLEIMQHHNDDLTQARGYRQHYTYDPMGNMLELRHRNLEDNQGGVGQYTRSFQPLAANNRLYTMEQGGITTRYTYDPNGNMTGEATNRGYKWNHADQLVRFRNQPGGNENPPEASDPTVDACYLYDTNGMRVKKIVRNGDGLLKTITYIGEVFEYCTRGSAEHNMIHLMDGEQRIALLRVGAPFSGDETNDPALQYILGDHLGNSSMTANGFGALIHREEFTPYGETSFGGYGEKRYRFTGKERDEESGLSYHSARYYLPWLGRWLSADPAGMVDGNNLYAYGKLNPIGLIDKNGKETKSNEPKYIDVFLTKSRKDMVTDKGTPDTALINNLESALKSSVLVVEGKDIVDFTTKIRELLSQLSKKYGREVKIDSAFINSHGFHVGKERITSDNVSSLKALSKFFSEEGEIVLLGCGIGGGEYDEGVMFTQKVSNAFNRPVYASKSLTPTGDIFNTNYRDDDEGWYTPLVYLTKEEMNASIGYTQSEVEYWASVIEKAEGAPRRAAKSWINNAGVWIRMIPQKEGIITSNRNVSAPSISRDGSITFLKNHISPSAVNYLSPELSRAIKQHQHRTRQFIETNH